MTNTLLRPAEVAKLLGVSAETVTRWARDGKIECVTLPSGHRRIPLAAVEAMQPASAP